MKTVFDNILVSISERKKLLAVLIDPDKTMPEGIFYFIQKVNKSIITHIFVGGSVVEEKITGKLVSEIKKHTSLPVILFPGDIIQITNKADAILFLSLISGRNPEYLIGKQIEAVSKLRNTNLEIIPTGYILIENGKKTSVERVTKTQPMPKNNIKHVVDTAVAGEYLGMKLIYLEAGSGATNPVESKMISEVKKYISIPLLVGGGIKSKAALEKAYQAGANLVVIGTAFEEDESFFEDISCKVSKT